MRNSCLGKWGMLFALPLAFVLIAAIPATASVVEQGADPCLPVPSSEYVGQYHQWQPNGQPVFNLNNPVHDRFTNCVPAPLGGGPQTHSFGSEIQGDLFIGGVFQGHVATTAAVTVVLTFGGTNGGVTTWSTQMTQLDAHLGSALIRIDPTTPSTGTTTSTDIGGGNFRIDSFFDVFTDLSLDGGVTWTPSTGPGPGGSTVMTLQNGPEPVSSLLIGAGLVAIGWRWRSKKPAR